MGRVIQLTPVWKPALSDAEIVNVDQSLSVLGDSNAQFLAPEGLDTSFYRARYPGIEIRRVPDTHLESIASYNEWITRSEFYEPYLGFEFLAVVQTDAVLLRNLGVLDLESIDFLGAPWPCGLRYTQLGGRLIVSDQCSTPAMNLNSTLTRLVGRTAWVGNGGLSVRRVTAFVTATRNLRRQMKGYVAQGLNEDIIFATAGVDAGLRVPSVELARSVFREHVTLACARNLNLVGVHAPFSSGT